jgi:hypothetical protein
LYASLYSFQTFVSLDMILDTFLLFISCTLIHSFFS